MRAGAALLITARARRIHEHAAHHTGRHREEMRAILPLHVTDIDELEVRLVDERGGLEGVPVSLVPHVAPGDAAKLRMDYRDELLESGFVSLPPCHEEVGDLRR